MLLRGPVILEPQFAWPKYTDFLNTQIFVSREWLPTPLSDELFKNYSFV